MMGEEKITKKIPNKKITSRMKKIINGEFIQKANDDAESKIKAWKEEILEKNIKEIENSIEAKAKNDVIDFQNLEVTEKKKKNLRKKEKNIFKKENKEEFLENIFKEEETKEKNPEEKEENTSKNFLNIDENFDKQEENLEEKKPEKKLRKEETLENKEISKEIFEEKTENSILEFEKKFEEKRKKEEILEKPKEKNILENEEKNLTSKIYEGYNVEIIKSEVKEEKTGLLKIFFYLVFLIFFGLGGIFIYQNKESFINFLEKTEDKEKTTIEKEIEKKVDEKTENKTITIGKNEFDIQIVTKENGKVYKFDGVEYKNFTKLKTHLNNLIEEQAKIDANDKIKQKIRAEFFN